MWSNLLRALGSSAARAEVFGAAKEILTKYGLASAKNFFSKLTPEQLATATKRELVDLAEESLKESAQKIIDNKIFSKSNARKLATIANKGTDYIEGETRRFLEGQSLRLLNQRYVDALGRSGVDASGRRLIPKQRSKTYTRARGFASDTLEAALFPTRPAQAFGVYYVRGVLGEGTANALNSLLVGTPRAVIATPRARAFIRTLREEVKYLRSVGQVRSASQLAKAIRKAEAAGRNLYGPQDPLITSKVAGYVSGRLTIPLASTYVFVDQDERKKNIDKFQRSIKPYAQNRVRTWVDSYVRQDGTRVKGHYRELVAA